MPYSAKDLVSRVDSVASLPTIFIQIDNLINNPESDLAEIAGIISEDTGLSARLLKIANSAMYSFPSEIDSIMRAITVIGTKQLRDLVLATQVVQIFSHIDDNVVNMNMFWKHSIATGILSRILATFRREPNVEYYYLLGLLHDVGRLVMYLEMPDKTAEIMQHASECNMQLHQAEIEMLGFDHAAVGAELLAAWKLPESMYDVLYFHHRPSLSLNYSDTTAIVHIADLVVNAISLGHSAEHYVPQLDEQAWQQLELSPAILRDAIDQLDRQFRDALELFLEVND